MHAAADKLWPWGKTNHTLEVTQSPPAAAEASQIVDASKAPVQSPGTPSPDSGNAPQPTLTDAATSPASVSELETSPPVVPELPPILSYWETIDGGYTGSTGLAGKVVDAVTGGDFVKFVAPVALTVQGDYLYVVDMGLDTLLRFNLITRRMERIMDLHGLISGEVYDVYVRPDFSFFITDTSAARVLYFNAKGTLKRIYENKLNLVWPVAVTDDPQTGDLLIADGEFDHILVFNAKGELVTAVGGRGSEPGKFLNVTALAHNSDTFFVAARVGQRIQALDHNGDYLYSFPQDSVTFPMAMAADDEFRLFVGDYLDNSIKVYDRGRFVTSIGGSGVGPGSFKRVTDLYVAKEFLYVADNLNSRVQVLKIAASSPPLLTDQ